MTARADRLVSSYVGAYDADGAELWARRIVTQADRPDPHFGFESSANTNLARAYLSTLRELRQLLGRPT